MDLEALAATVRQTLTAHPLRPETGYPPEAKEVGLVYARACRAAGETWASAAGRVPISTTTLGKWLRQAPCAPEDSSLQLVPVQVRDPIPSRGGSVPVLVSPTGFRLEGMTVSDAVAALGALR